MDSLDIDGKEYISARRAAKENGYVADYIGQLIRSGKLEGKKVGRAWYVSRESLETHFQTGGVKAENAQVSVTEIENASSTVASRESAIKVSVVRAEEAPEVLVNEKKELEGSLTEGADQKYPLLRYMQDDEPELPPLLQSFSENQSSDDGQAAAVPIRVVSGSNLYREQAKEEVAEDIQTIDGAQYASGSAEALRAAREIPSTMAPAYLDRSPESSMSRLAGSLATVVAVVVALAGISFGAASVLATKEITYKDSSLSASLNSLNIGMPR